LPVVNKSISFKNYRNSSNKSVKKNFSQIIKKKKTQKNIFKFD